MDKERFMHLAKNAEERQFLAHFLDLCLRARKERSCVFTDFLTPGEAILAEQAANGIADLVLYASGLVDGAERKVLAICHDQCGPSEEEFGLIALEIVSNNKKELELRHPDVLGAMLGLGIVRKVLGDIIITPTAAYCICRENIAPVILGELQQVGRVGVTVSIVGVEDLPKKEENWPEISVSVASLRLDAVLAAVYHMSREEASRKIKSGQVKVNFREEIRPAINLEENDLVSVRWHGRFRIKATAGQTRSGRQRLIISRTAES